MTLDELVLPRLADWHPPAGRQTLNLPGEGSGWAVAVTADRHDELGSLLWDVALRRTGPALADLAGWARRVAERVTGLLEPLKVVEIDAQRNEALLRSDEPAHRKEQLFYYEVLLHPARGATVRRFQAAQGPGRREQVLFALTNESLAKLLGDLAAAA